MDRKLDVIEWLFLASDRVSVHDSDAKRICPLPFAVIWLRLGR